MLASEVLSHFEMISLILSKDLLFLPFVINSFVRFLCCSHSSASSQFFSKRVAMNISSFSTPTSSHPSPSQPCSNVVSTLFTVIISMVTLAALIGNVLIIASFFKTPNLRTRTKQLLHNQHGHV